MNISNARLAKLLARRKAQNKSNVLVAAAVACFEMAAVLQFLAPTWKIFALIPLAVAIVHAFFPTLLGWIILFAPLVLASCVLTVEVASKIFTTIPPGVEDPAMMSVFIFLVLVVPVLGFSAAFYFDRPAPLIAETVPAQKSQQVSTSRKSIAYLTAWILATFIFLVIWGKSSQSAMVGMCEETKRGEPVDTVIARGGKIGARIIRQPGQGEPERIVFIKSFLALSRRSCEVKFENGKAAETRFYITD